MRTCRTDARGFTLLETLVALALVAVVLSGLYTAVARAAVARERATATAERTATVRTLLLRLASELEAVTTLDEPQSDERFVVTAPTPQAPAWSALRFPTRDGRTPADDEIRLVAYRVEPPGHLARREALRFPPPDASEPKGSTLLEAVRRFRVRCFDGTAWREQWSVPRPPQAVEITIGVDDGKGGTDELTTRVALASRSAP